MGAVLYSEKIKCHCGSIVQYKCCYKGQIDTDSSGSSYPVGLPSFASIRVNTSYGITCDTQGRFVESTTTSYYHCCPKCLPKEVGVSVLMGYSPEGWAQIDPNGSICQYTGYQKLVRLEG